MSKSLGNVVLVKDLKIDPKGFRMFLLATHYRGPINYSDEGLEVYHKEWMRLEKSVKTLYRTLDLRGALDPTALPILPEIQKSLADFDEAMENDFNTANALTAMNQLWTLVNQLSRQKSDLSAMNQALNAMNRMLSVLGLEVAQIPLSPEEKALFSRWEAARQNKDFAAADALRAQLAERNLI
jgi:cysteinyl-tRNA synthetase